MVHILGQMALGLVTGLVAKFLIPGRDPGGLIVTMLVGVAGGWVGGYISRLVGWSKQGEAAGFLMSVVGAMVLLLGYRAL